MRPAPSPAARRATALGSSFLGLSLLSLSALGFLVAGCQTTPPESTTGPSPVLTPLPTDLAGLQAEIERITQPPRATRAASCRAVAYGSKACGGPSRFVVASAESTDTVRLGALTDRYTTVEAEENRRTGAVSDCMMLAAPPVTLAGGMCVAGR